MCAGWLVACFVIDKRVSKKSVYQIESADLVKPKKNGLRGRRDKVRYQDGSQSIIAMKGRNRP